MAATVYSIDTQLLVLLIAGMTSVALIGRHKRLRAYSPEDFNSLCTLLGNPPRLLLTPHTLTETSNLLRQTDEPVRSKLLRSLAGLVRTLDERTITSRLVIMQPAFARLGLTDAALLAMSCRNSTLLTVDFDLWGAAIKARLPVINFSHIRQAGA